MFSISPSNGRREQLGGERGKYGEWGGGRGELVRPIWCERGVGEET